jgi:hypothetical protein
MLPSPIFGAGATKNTATLQQAQQSNFFHALAHGHLLAKVAA